MKWRDLPHLGRRFLRSLSARRPDPAGQIVISQYVAGELAELFWDQPVADQAHAVRVAHRVLDSGLDRSELVRAALLHDVGKRHSRLGTVGRSIATLLALIRLPRPPRARLYLEHAESGGAELEDLGAEAIVVEFARFHHSERPEHVDEQSWAVLVNADRE